MNRGERAKIDAMVVQVKAEIARHQEGAAAAIETLGLLRKMQKQDWIQVSTYGKVERAVNKMGSAWKAVEHGQHVEITWGGSRIGYFDRHGIHVTYSYTNPAKELMAYLSSKGLLVAPEALSEHQQQLDKYWGS